MRPVLAAVIVLLLAGGAARAEIVAGRAVVMTDERTSSDPAPLIVALHGFTGTGRAFQRKTGFDKLARQYGFVVAYPSGPGRRWEYAAQASADAAYLTDLIRTLIAQGRADPRQIYLAGHSNGGSMALRMACTRPALVSAIAVVSMNAPADVRCDTAPPLPAFFIHGAQDPIVPANGLRRRGSFGGVLSVFETLAIWQRRNTCADTPPEVRQFNQTRGPSTVSVAAYTGCAAALRHITISHHGHEWPGAGARAVWLQGPASREIDAAAAIWQFFDQL